MEAMKELFLLQKIDVFQNYPDHKSLDNLLDMVYSTYYKDWNYKYIIDRAPVGTPGNLRLLQKHGHQPIVLLGGGTTRIGDPSGKEETRKILSEKEIEKNIKNIEKIFKIFLKTKNKKTKPIFVNNYKWLGKLNYIKFLREIGKHFTINKSLIGPDHKTSITGNELKNLVQGIKKVSLALGDKKKKITSKKNAFYTLAKSITGQQISVKAANAIWTQLEKKINVIENKKYEK